MIKIPVYQPSLNGREKEYVMDCLDSSWISSKGKYLPLFERAFADRIQVKHATSVSNGTVALHLAMLALGIGPDDEVIVPTLTYIAPVNAVAYTGAKPVFADSVRETWQLDPKEVRKKLTPKTRAILAVHLYGHPCDLEPLAAIARENNLYLVEDCAEAFGSLYQGRSVGSFGHIAAFSFFGNKTITTGEGGMVVTKDNTLHQRAVHFKGQGLAAYREYWHDVIGYNYRMSNICAAIGLAQLEQADAFIARKRRLATWYREELPGLPLEFHGESGDILHTYWMCSILVDDADDRDPLRAHLARQGIETRPLFHPVHTMPMYCNKFQRHPVAEDLGWRGINLPSWPDLTRAQVHEICEAIRAFFQERRPTAWKGTE
ncbi:MAG: DegT/DnrJ/EryC1/StrS family aminotransferase [Magnetococcales bacterium]|nr:DegT/DnrJ/EryC1/StrS family aminotransferase [Magnetococcales bacterium]